MDQRDTTPQPFLIAESLSWHVGDKLILNGLNFSINAGEFVGLIGPNGAGKSSLLRCIYGHTKASSGRIQLFERELDSYPKRELAQSIAVVLQEPPSRFELSVNDVIRMGLTPHKSLLSFDNQEDMQRVEKASRQVDLYHKLGQQFNSLSGGEKQRAMIARAIVQQPSLLIMDEPTNHLDIRHQLEVLSLAKSMGITVLVSIHDLNLAAAYCDRLVLLNSGRIVAEGAPASVLTESNLEQVFGVTAQVDTHPFNHKLRITFDLGERANG